jgi:Protein of unknown function (DUF3987)
MVTQYQEAPKVFKYTVNTSGRDKNWDFEKLATDYRDVDGSIYDVMDAVKKGYALCAGWLDGKRRCKFNITGSGWVLLDIDNSAAKLDENGKPIKGEKVYKHQLTLEEAVQHPFVKSHCALIYTTASHTPDWHKFRMIFLLPEPVENAESVEAVVKFLMSEFPHDPACKDASRVFYGSTKAEFPLVNPSAVLPSEWVQQAKDEAQEDRLAFEERVRVAQLRKERYPDNSQDTDALVLEALKYIPSRNPGSGNYEECTKVAMGLTAYFGASEAERIIEQWSPSIPGDSWNVPRKVKSYQRANGCSVGTVFWIAKQYGFKFPENKMSASGRTGAKNRSVTGDSRFSGDTSNQDRLNITATVTSVTDILNLGLSDFEECQKLEEVEARTELNKNPFWMLVQSIKCQLDEVTPEDKHKLNDLIVRHSSAIDFKKALPVLSDPILHDSKVLNVDPIVIWQPFMAAISSLVGTRVKIDVESHTIPCISWTMTVLESGGGKTRADKLIFAYLKEKQSKERERFEAAVKEWEQKDATEDGEKKPSKPVERKWLYEVATPQALLRRSSEQKNCGQVWNRDELPGLFKSLGQFTKGDGEGKEILLKLWDGSPFQNDRVNQEDSYFINETAISINGGIQPGIFRNIFKDPNDSQGLLARFLIATPKLQKMKRTKGRCQLADILPALYDWLENCPMGSIKLSKESDSLYDHLYNQIGEQAYKESHRAVRAWMSKLPSHLLRIALVLHLIECFFEADRNFWEIQKDTLSRAVLFAQYYQSAFHVIQETTTDSDDMSSILLKIWDAAAAKPSEGITPREAYRNIKAIQHRAKAASREVGVYTIELFYKLQEMGKGQVVKSGRSIKFIVSVAGVEIVEDENQKNNDAVTVVTVAETNSEQALEVSPEKSLSPVTDDNLPGDAPTPTPPKKQEFDDTANAQLILDCLQEENAGEMISQLAESWSDEQKAAVESRLSELYLTAEQYAVVWESLKKFNNDKRIATSTHSSKVNNQESVNTATDAKQQKLNLPSPSPVKTNVPEIGSWVVLSNKKSGNRLYQVVEVDPNQKLGRVFIENPQGTRYNEHPSTLRVLSEQEVSELELSPWLIESSQ